MKAPYAAEEIPSTMMADTEWTRLLNTDTPSRYILIPSTKTAIDHATTCSTCAKDQMNTNRVPAA